MLFSQSQNHQRPQLHVSFNRFMFGVLKQIVWQIERNFSSHFTRRQ
jgi:hypothetical protein